MRKFKVACTGISGRNGKLTPEMGILEESALPNETFDQKVKDGEIVEIKPAKKTETKK